MADKTGEAGAKQALQELISSPVYQENLAFWDRAWRPVKTPYTQLPDLPYLQDILDFLRQHDSRTILDLGCGSGWLSIFLARNGFDVTGVDISQQATNLGKMWAEQEQLTIRFDAADIAALPYRAGQFDAVVANSIFEHLTLDLAASTMDTVRHLLKTGGVFIGCFDKVGGGPGEFYELEDGTHVYTDKGRKGMLLRYFNNDELKSFFQGWHIDRFEELESGTRFVCARP